MSDAWRSPSFFSRGLLILTSKSECTLHQHFSVKLSSRQPKMQEDSMISPVTESESGCSGISSLSGRSKQERKFKNRGTSVAVSPASSTGSVLKMATKDLAKKGLKRRADEDEAGESGPADTVQTKLEVQSECNLISTARACKRQKECVADLEERLFKERQKTNEIIRAQIEMLRGQNEFLLAELRRDYPAAAPSPSAPSLSTAQIMFAQVLEGLSFEQLSQVEELWQNLHR
jgi:hypothetical protein